MAGSFPGRNISIITKQNLGEVVTQGGNTGNINNYQMTLCLSSCTIKFPVLNISFVLYHYRKCILKLSSFKGIRGLTCVGFVTESYIVSLYYVISIESKTIPAFKLTLFNYKEEITP